MGSHLEVGKRLDPPFLQMLSLQPKQEPQFLRHGSKAREAMLESILMEKSIQRSASLLAVSKLRAAWF